jgi:hypothetical protein
LTDGYLNISLLKLGKDQTGVGLDYQGLHHIGLVVDDLDAWTQHIEALGAPNITTLADMPPTARDQISRAGQRRLRPQPLALAGRRAGRSGRDEAACQGPCGSRGIGLPARATSPRPGSPSLH